MRKLGIALVLAISLSACRVHVVSTPNATTPTAASLPTQTTKPTATQAQLPTQTPKTVCQVTANVLNVRAWGDIGAPVVGWLEAGDEVNVLGGVGWVRVETGSCGGYVFSRYLGGCHDKR